MRLSTFTAISALALAGFAVGAQAQTVQNQSAANKETTVEKSIRQGWENTKEAVSGAAENIRALFVEGEETAMLDTPYINIDYGMTAKGLLDRAVYNTAGETVGNVDDIILNDEGEAEMVVISHGGFLGIGTAEAAFDYGMVMRSAADGDVIMPVSKESLDAAVPFSYDRDDAAAGKNVRVIPEGRMRVSELLDSDVVNTRGEVVAETDNIHFSNGEADHMILSLNREFSASGDLAAVNYDELQVMPTEMGKYRFNMSAALSDKFESLRKTAMK